MNLATPASTEDKAESLPSTNSSTSTIGKAAKRGDAEEPSGPSLNDKQMREEVPPIQEAVAGRQTAAPPAVNPWDIRKKNLSSAVVPKVATASVPQPTVSSSSLQTAATGSPSSSAQGRTAVTTSAVIGGEAKTNEAAKGGKKKKKPVGEVTPIADPSLWPDVAQAAEAAKKEDEKREAAKPKKETEEASVTEEASTSTSELDSTFCIDFG
jgi:hypothetical protein